MDHWEDNTCLLFVHKTSSTRDYIKITQWNSYPYFSNSIGKSGGVQQVNVKSDAANRFGTVVHEFGHAIGFWHEQTRPDRGSYIRVNTNNIVNTQSARHQFMQRANDEVDSLSVEYDYGSIMHYHDTAFQKANCAPPCKTLEVINQNVYAAQGRPRLGQRIRLSTRDIEQAKRLYRCPRSGGERRRLVIKVRNAVNLPDTDPIWNAPDPYVKIAASHYSGTIHKQTSVKSGTQSPTWNEHLDFGVQDWHSFRVKIWDDDNFLTFGDDPMSIGETFEAKKGYHTNVKHCTNTACSGYLWLDFSLCPTGFSGVNCAFKNSRIRFYIRTGHNLPDKDGW